MNDLFWLTLILFAVAAVLRSELFFYLLYVLVGLQVVARVWVARSSERLTWMRRAPTTLFPGEEGRVELEIVNGSLLPLPWLSVHESMPPNLRSPSEVREVLSLGAGERRVIAYGLRSERRGYYQVGPLTLRTGDVLGLRERTLDGGGQSGITVYPKVLSLAELGLPASLPFGALPRANSLFTDPARPAGVRPYQPGDDPRRIDWKNSARAGLGRPGAELLVRRSQPAIALETLVALSFGLGEYERFAYDDMERALTAATAIVAYLVGLRQPVGLATSGRDPLADRSDIVLPVRPGREHLLQMLGVLGRLETTADGDLPALLDHAGAGLGWGSTIVVVGGGGLPLVERLAPLRRRGFNVAIVTTRDDPAVLGLARRHGMGAHSIRRDGRPTG